MYNKTNELPDAVKNLPGKAQDIWMKEYNAAFKQYDGDKAKSAAVAWNAVGNAGYTRDKTQNESDKSNVIFTFSFPIELSESDKVESGENEEHLAISRAQLFKEGKFKSRIYGDVVFNEKIFDELISNFYDNVWGSEVAVGLPFDAEHYDYLGALGWFKEIYKTKSSEGKWGLFAIVEWTPLGEKFIREKRYKYVSGSYYPEFADPETGEAFKNVLCGAALTTSPFLRGMEPVGLSEFRKQSLSYNSNEELLDETPNKVTETSVAVVAKDDDNDSLNNTVASCSNEAKKEAPSKKASREPDGSDSLEDNLYKFGKAIDVSCKGLDMLREQFGLTTSQLKAFSSDTKIKSHDIKQKEEVTKVSEKITEVKFNLSTELEKIGVSLEDLKSLTAIKEDLSAKADMIKNLGVVKAEMEEKVTQLTSEKQATDSKLEEERKLRLTAEEKIVSLAVRNIEQQVDTKVGKWALNDNGVQVIKPDMVEHVKEFSLTLEKIDNGMVTLSNKEYSLTKSFDKIMNSMPGTKIQTKATGHGQEGDGETDVLKLFYTDGSRTSYTEAEDSLKTEQKVNAFARKHSLSFNSAFDRMIDEGLLK